MKIIASDFDGTLNYNGKVSCEDKEAIHRFRLAGNRFGLVTGRDVECAQWIKPTDGLELDFVICCTGAVIKDGDGKIIYMKKGKVDGFFDTIIEKAKSLGAEFFTVGDVMFKCYVDTSGAIPADISRIDEFTHANCCFKRDEEAIAFVDYVNQNFSDYISAHRNGRFVDMPPAHTSKVSGIYEYAKMVGEAEIYTVGDNANDILMLKEFNSYAVSNAGDEVKAAAKKSCDRVCNMIEELMKESE